MPIVTNIKIVAAALVLMASPAAISMSADRAPPGAALAPSMVDLAPGTLRYWPPGEFTLAGKPVGGPERIVQFRRPVAIMANLVSAAEYQRCVDEAACEGVRNAAAAPDRPAVMVSWRDATAYAAWLTRKLGVTYRLPTDEEWTYAAGSRAPDEAPIVIDSDDPARGWLRRYQRETELAPADKEAKPIGHFGRNENGLSDVAGNVWEWTDTCFTRATLDGGVARVVTENCGVRIAEGRHRAYVTDFIRDARGGGCAGGAPPSHLGFRLVRENARSWWLF